MAVTLCRADLGFDCECNFLGLFSPHSFVVHFRSLIHCISGYPLYANIPRTEHMATRSPDLIHKLDPILKQDNLAHPRHSPLGLFSKRDF